MDRRPNKEIRREIQKSEMKTWEIAKVLGISESTLYRWLRTEFTPDQLQTLRQILKEAKA